MGARASELFSLVKEQREGLKAREVTQGLTRMILGSPNVLVLTPVDETFHPRVSHLHPPRGTLKSVQ